MGKKGQVVIPKTIRDRLGLGPQSKFVVYSHGDVVVMKKLTVADVRKDLEAVFRSIDRKDLGLTEGDIEQEVHAYRQERRARTGKKTETRR